MSDTIVGSVGVQLVPSAEGFREKARTLLSGLTATVAVHLDDVAARAQLEDLARSRTATINANADTAAAEARLDELARSRRASVSVDSKGLDSASSSAGSLGGALGIIAGSLAVLAPALVPIGAAFGGIAASAGIAAGAVVSLEAKQKELTKATQKAATAQTRATYDAAIAQAKAIQASISGPEKAFLGAQGALGAAFSGLIATVGPSLFGALAAGLNLVADILPRLAPLVIQVSNIFGDLFTKLDQGVQAGAMTTFLNYVMANIPPVLALVSSLGTTLGNLFVGLAPAGQTLLTALNGIFGLLAKVPGEILAPIAVGLLGLVASPLVAGIAVLAFAFETLYAKSATVRNGVAQLASAFRQAFGPTISQIIAVIGVFTSALGGSGNSLRTFAGISLRALVLQIRIAGAEFAFLFKVISQGVIGALRAIAFLAAGFSKVFGVLGRLTHNKTLQGLAAELNRAARNADVLAGSVGNAARAVASIPNRTVHITIVQSLVTIRRKNGLAAGGLGTGGGVLLPSLGGGHDYSSQIKQPNVSIPTIRLPSFSGGGGGGGGGGGSTKAPKGPTAQQKFAASAHQEARNLLAGLTAAAKAGGTKLLAVLANIKSHLKDLPQGVRTPLRVMVDSFTSQLKTLTTRLEATKTKLAALKDQFKQIASTVSSAFKPGDLFGGTLGQLKGGLATALVNVKGALAAQKKLLSEGISQTFVTSLLSSGNGALAVQLAANPALAQQLAAQYGALNTAADALGHNQAQAEVGPKIDATNKELRHIKAALDTLDHRIATAISKEIKKAIPPRK